MSWKRSAADAANAILQPIGVRLVQSEMPWDSNFSRWIKEAEASGIDPNDVGDREWDNDRLDEALREFYLPHVSPDAVVLELGPGTGRVTRHIVGRCREMLLVDYSPLVCDWLRRYLSGKGNFRVLKNTTPTLPMIGDDYVDFILAHGVFEHIEVDDLYCFLEEFRRVLKPGGTLSFNFNNIMSNEGLGWFKKFRPEPGLRCVFRFYHPDTLSRLANDVGLSVERLSTDSGRLAQIELRKAA